MTRAFFDLETRCLASELGDGAEGWAALKRGEGGISAACVLMVYQSPSVECRRAERVFIYDDYSVEALAERLEAADQVVTFNGTHFDIPIVEALLGRPLDLKDHVDLKPILGGSLNKNAWKLLGRGKSGKGEDAPALLRDGHLGELFNYCLDDVYLTRDVWVEWDQAGQFGADLVY